MFITAKRDFPERELQEENPKKGELLRKQKESRLMSHHRQMTRWVMTQLRSDTTKIPLKTSLVLANILNIQER